MMSETKIAAGIIMLAFVLVGCGWVIASHFEAQSYNRVTGSNVTTWEAMWIELRVQEGAGRGQDE
jgi:hypothetical protein